MKNLPVIIFLLIFPHVLFCQYGKEMAPEQMSEYVIHSLSRNMPLSEPEKQELEDIFTLYYQVSDEYKSMRDINQVNILRQERDEKIHLLLGEMRFKRYLVVFQNFVLQNNKRNLVFY